jgi:hypothetical protein
MLYSSLAIFLIARCDLHLSACFRTVVLLPVISALYSPIFATECIEELNKQIVVEISWPYLRSVWHESLTAVVMQSSAFWDIMSCNSAPCLLHAGLFLILLFSLTMETWSFKSSVGFYRFTPCYISEDTKLFLFSLFCKSIAPDFHFWYIQIYWSKGNRVTDTAKHSHSYCCYLNTRYLESCFNYTYSIFTWIVLSVTFPFFPG